MIHDQPLVSVLMPVFNAERYLSQAVQSILDQTYKNFEFIIIEDGSTDNSPKILEDFQKIDERIHLICQTSNLGLVDALNFGLGVSQGKYIARMDADDISLPERLYKQVKYMEANQEVGLLGCSVHHIDANGNFLRTPSIFLDDVYIRWHILFESPFYHPAVMMRKSVIEKGRFSYDSAYQHAEDLELWSRMLLVTKGANLPDILLDYRFHTGSISREHKRLQTEKGVAISTKSIQLHLPSIPASSSEIEEFSRSFIGVNTQAKQQRAHLINVYFLMWTEFCKKNCDSVKILELKREVFAWAARMILYPPFQTGSLRALWILTKKDFRWPLYFIGLIPYFLSRRRIG